MRILKKRFILFILTGLLIVGIVFANKMGFSLRAENQAVIPAASNKISVETISVKSIEKISNYTYKATIEPVDFGIVSTKVSGKVSKVLFENGDIVKVGDSLVVLDDQDLRNQLTAAENQLKSLNNQLKGAINQLNVLEPTLKKAQDNKAAAQRNYDRIKDSYMNVAAIKQDLDKVEDALKMANSDVLSVQSNMDGLAINIDTLKINIDAAKININTINDAINNTVIRAPISGVVDEKNVSVGQYISIQGGSSVLAKVKDISSVNAVIQVEQSNLNYIKVGQKATVKLDEVADKIFEGVIKKIDVSANPSARTFNCKVEVNNKDLLLHPGVFAKVEISNGEKQNVIAMPIQCLMGTEGSYFVFVVENGVAVKKNVTIGEITKDLVNIKSGINEGDNVISTNLSTLQDGDQVNAVTKQGV